MNVAYFDTIAGIAGDMTMAAFVSAGLTIDELSHELAKLSIGGFDLVGSHVERNGISAVHIDVVISQAPHYHRHLKDIHSIIEASALSEETKTRAKSIFDTIAQAEAKVHNTTIEKVHFHEVGALDSVVDVVGAAICLEKFGIERVYSSPVRLGSGGFVETQHGTMPVPTPATLEILKDYPTVLIMGSILRRSWLWPSNALIKRLRTIWRSRALPRRSIPWTTRTHSFCRRGTPCAMTTAGNIRWSAIAASLPRCVPKATRRPRG